MSKKKKNMTRKTKRTTKRERFVAWVGAALGVLDDFANRAVAGRLDQGVRCELEVPESRSI